MCGGNKLGNWEHNQPQESVQWNLSNPDIHLEWNKVSVLVRFLRIEKRIHVAN